MPFHDRPALSITLLPGQATALNFRARTRVLLSGDAGVPSLSAHAVSDRPAPASEPHPLELVGAVPLPNLGYPDGAYVDLPDSGPTSLLLHNTGPRPVSFVASVRAPASDSLFGDPALVPVRDLGERFADSDAVLVGPELRYLELHRTGADDPEPLRYDVSSFGRRDPIRLRVRALTPRSSGEVDRKISVTLFDTDGRALYREMHSVSLPVTPFERASTTAAPPGASDDRFRWVSEDTLLYVTNHARGAQLEVQSDRPALVSTTAEGVPRGDTRRYRLPHGNARVRFGADQATAWHRLLPTNHEQLRADQTVRLEGVVRLAPEIRDQDDGGASRAVSYALLTPESEAQRDAGRLYLVRENRARRWPVEYYCSYENGADQVFRFDEVAWKESRGLIKTVLWAPPAALGSHFRVLFDDRVWRSGTIRARVTTGTQPAPSTTRRVTLMSDPGVRMWLQAHGRRWPCRAPHRVVKAFPLAPGTSTSFAWRKTRQTRGVLLTGFSTAAAVLHVSIDGGRPGYTTGLHEHATPPAWATRLFVTPERAEQLVSPGTSLRRLSSDFRRIGGNIPMGEHRLTVKNLSPQSVDLRTLVQINAPPSGAAARPQWVRRDALEIW